MLPRSRLRGFVALATSSTIRDLRHVPRHADPDSRLLPGISAGQIRGDEGNRTPNPRLAKAVLCQLSYVPEGVDLSVRSAC